MAHQPGHLGESGLLRQQFRRAVPQGIGSKAKHRLPLLKTPGMACTQPPGQIMQCMVQHRQCNLAVRPPHRREAGRRIALSACAAADAAFERHIIVAAVPGGLIGRRPDPVLQQADVGDNLVIVVHAMDRHQSALILVGEQIDQIEQRRRTMRHGNGQPFLRHQQRSA